MSIVQWYRGQVIIGGQLMPVPANGAAFDWNRNYQIPPIAGNDYPQNFHEGVQVPTCDVQLVGLDGEAARNPFGLSFFQLATLRTGNSNDIPTTTLSFFDGFSGYTGFNAKMGSFNLRGAKGQAVSLSASFACYQALNQSAPVQVTTAPGTASPWLGSQVFFTSLGFSKNGSPFSGVYSFNLTYSTQITPDMEMQGTGQQLFPIDMNAGMPSCAFQLVFQADQADHILPGDNFTITVNQGANVARTFYLPNLLPEPKGRNIGSGRQMRVYNGQSLGSSNLVPPLLVT